jgi:hypothetical protein
MYTVILTTAELAALAAEITEWGKVATAAEEASLMAATRAYQQAKRAQARSARLSTA